MKGSSPIKLVLSLVVGVACLLKLLILTGCANIIPPAGGPRDTLPPKLVNANPPDSTVNFRGDRVTLTFDEFVDLQDLQNNVLFTPTFEHQPVIAVRQKSIGIRFKDSLLPRTTYTLNFGNAIKDINEGNVLRNFQYVFSTGSRLDSLTISGKVLLAETGQVDTTVLVLLHKSLIDSAVIKDRPRYITKVDKNGYFRFTSLPRDTFAIYALGDAGFSKRYQSKTQLFAFADAPVVSGSRDSIALFAYREMPKVNAGSATAGTGAKTTTSERRLRFTTNIGGNQLDLMDSVVLTFATPLRSFDPARVSLTRDSSFATVPFTALEDTSRMSASIRTPWAEGTRYNLILQKDFATDTSGRQLLKADTVSFTTKRKSDYGSLTIRFRNTDPGPNAILQFVQNDKVVFSAPVTNGTVTAPMFIPGDYELRVLNDRNGNGKWDTGHFFGTRRQPETARSLPRKITIRPAWDNEFTL